MKPRRVTVHAAITADGKLDSREDPAELRRLFADNLVTDIHLTVRPIINGQRRAATLGGLPGEFFPASIRCRLLKMEVRGAECLLHYRVLRRARQPAETRASAGPRATF